MIYNQSPFFYTLACLFTIILIVRLNHFFKFYFTNTYSWIIALTIIFHPLSIDAFIAPNTIAGPIAFWIFLESLFLIRKEKFTPALILMILASVCNTAYTFIPIFVVLTNWKKLKDYRIPCFIYFVFICMYLSRNYLKLHHKPLVFLTYFLQNIIAPFTINIFEFSLFHASTPLIIFSFLLFGFFIFKQRNEIQSRAFWPYIILPAFGVLYHPWNEKFKFWHEIIFTPSSYICITFAVVAMLAFHLPKKVFYGYTVFIIIFSALWSFQWNPLSNLIDYSITSLPPSFTEMITAKRLLAWELLYENQTERGETLLRGLLIENPKNEDIWNDLNFHLKMNGKKELPPIPK